MSEIQSDELHYMEGTLLSKQKAGVVKQLVLSADAKLESRGKYSLSKRIGRNRADSMEQALVVPALNS